YFFSFSFSFSTFLFSFSLFSLFSFSSLSADHIHVTLALNWPPTWVFFSCHFPLINFFLQLFSNFTFYKIIYTDLLSQPTWLFNLLNPIFHCGSLIPHIHVIYII